MRLYRDLDKGETLQAGDEIYSGREWIPIAEQSVGVVLSGRELLLFRRPVDLPMLQRVTPEAMSELELREAVGVLMVTPYNQAGDNIVRVMSFVAGKWGHYRDGWMAEGLRPSAGWFIELETLKEVHREQYHRLPEVRA